MRNDVLSQAERVCIGAMIRDVAAAWALRDMLRPEMFMAPLRSRLCSTIFGLLDENKRPSITLICGRMGEEDDDGISLSTSLLIMAGEAEKEEANPLDLASEIVERWRARSGAELAAALTKALASPTADVTAILAEAGEKLADLTKAGTDGAGKPLASVLGRVMSEATRARETDFVPGFETGLSPLDEILGRMMPGDLGSIAGSPGDGKTALGVQIAMRAAAGRRVALFELEMQDEAVGRRMLAGEADLSAAAIEEGAFDLWAIDRLRAAETKLSSLLLTIVDTPKLTIAQIRQRCVAMKRGAGLDMVVVDHLRLVRGTGKRQDKFERMEEVCEELKALAKDLKVVVILLSQRTKESQKRDDPTPRLTDMDGGGALEQYADWIVSVFRRDRWIRQTKLNGKPLSGHDNASEWVSKYYDCQGKAELSILKRRRGEDGETRVVKFNGKASRFEE